jgi:homoserine acetyltransferase
MQVLQWGVSYPDMMDGLVAMVPLAKTPAWTVVVLETTSRAIMLDPAWNSGNYTAVPREGRAALARHSQFAGGANAGHVPSAIQDQHGCSAVDDVTGRRGAEGIRC